MADSKLEHRLKTKKKGGRPRGSKTVTKLSAGRLMDLFDGCYSAEEWARRFKKLSPESQFKYRAQLEPRAKEERTASIFRLVIDGIKGPVICPKCSHEFTVTPPPTPPDAPQSTISSPATPEADLSGGPRQYVPDPDALKQLQQAREEELPCTWYEAPGDFDPEKET